MVGASCDKIKRCRRPIRHRRAIARRPDTALADHRAGSSISMFRVYGAGSMRRPEFAQDWRGSDRPRRQMRVAASPAWPPNTRKRIQRAGRGQPSIRRSSIKGKNPLARASPPPASSTRRESTRSPPHACRPAWHRHRRPHARPICPGRATALATHWAATRVSPIQRPNRGKGSVEARKSPLSLATKSASI